MERMTRPDPELLKKHHAFHTDDSVFAAHARLLQSQWAVRSGLPMAERKFVEAGKTKTAPPLGNFVEERFAVEKGVNFLTDGIRTVVADELKANAARTRAQRKVIREDRLYTNLLSSQPLAFNLFGELKLDPVLATLVFQRLFPDRIQHVTAIEFDHNPGRGSQTYIGDRSSFDVLIEYEGTKGKGFIGIEVKYAEDLKNKATTFRSEYRDVALASRVFKPDAVELLCTMPKGVEQVWRDHLLCLAMQPPVNADFAEGFFLFLYPKDNRECQEVVNRYRKFLVHPQTFVPLTMEELVATMKAADVGTWVDALAERYLAFDQLVELR